MLALTLCNMRLPFSLDSRMSYSPQVQAQLGRETLAEMADMSWYLLLSGRPSNCLFVFSFTLLVHLVVMVALRGSRRNNLSGNLLMLNDVEVI